MTTRSTRTVSDALVAQCRTAWGTIRRRAPGHRRMPTAAASGGPGAPETVSSSLGNEPEESTPFVPSRSLLRSQFLATEATGGHWWSTHHDVRPRHAPRCSTPPRRSATRQPCPPRVESGGHWWSTHHEAPTRSTVTQRNWQPSGASLGSLLVGAGTQAGRLSARPGC